MNVKKDERLLLSQESKNLAELLSKLALAEDYHEESGIEPTTDMKDIYVEDLKAREYGFKVGSMNLSYRYLYSYTANLFIEFIRKYMLEFANNTINTGIEYLLILLRDGKFLILEGDENKVQIPFPDGLATVHTHPGICLFSEKDLETADYLFSRGYFIIGVMNNTCISIIYRNGVYTLEDKEMLIKFYKKLKK
ncbi:MAG: hypothetical protein QXO96_03120, partial [Sulfolobales archaeon]